MKRIAMPVKESKLCSEFEQCYEFIIFSIDDNSNWKKKLVYSHLQSGLFPYWLAQKGVTDLIVNNINLNTIHKLDQYKINVFVGVKETDPNILIKNYMDNVLETSNVSVKC